MKKKILVSEQFGNTGFAKLLIDYLEFMQMGLLILSCFGLLFFFPVLAYVVGGYLGVLFFLSIPTIGWLAYKLCGGWLPR